MIDLFIKTFSFSLRKMLSDGLESLVLLVDYCDVFIRCLDSHSDRHLFTPEDSLVSK